MYVRTYVSVLQPILELHKVVHGNTCRIGKDGTDKVNVSEEFPSSAKGDGPGESFVQVSFIHQPPYHACLEDLHVYAETKDTKMHDMTDEDFHG